jgi:hypothetical protein
MADWATLQQYPQMNNLSTFQMPDPAQNALTILKAADMMDQQKSRQLQNRIAELQYQGSEQHVEGQKSLSGIAKSKPSTPTDILTSQGYVDPDSYRTWAVRYPMEAGAEQKQQIEAMLANAAGRRKATLSAGERYITSGDPEVGGLMLNNAYPGMVPMDENATAALPEGQGTPGGQVPPASPANAIAQRYASPGGMIPGQTQSANALATPPRTTAGTQPQQVRASAQQRPYAVVTMPNGQQSFLGKEQYDLGMSMGLLRTRGVKVSVLPANTVIDNQATRQQIANMTPQGQAPAQQQGTTQPAGPQSPFRSVRVEQKMNQILTSNDPPEKKRADLEQLLPDAAGSPKLLNTIKTAAALLTNDNKEPPGTETNYRQGLEDQIRQDHPDWSRSKIRFEAAKQVRRENQQNQIDVATQKAQKASDLKSKDIDIGSIAASVADGHDARIAIKGSMGNPVASKVESEVLKKYPHFDFTMSDANYKWKQSATNQRTVNFAQGSLPRLTRLDEQLSSLPNADLNTINRIMRAVSVETGKPEYTNFESNRNAIVQEINTALSGSSSTSDARVHIELDNLKSARSPAQIRGAITNLREALLARLDTDLSPIYPIEVVRGEKTMQQYKDEMFKKYRGNYGEDGSTGASSGSWDALRKSKGW